MTDADGEIPRLECGVSLVEFPLTEVIRLDVRPYEVFFREAGGGV